MKLLIAITVGIVLVALILVVVLIPWLFRGRDRD